MAFEPGIKLRAIELYLELHSIPKVHEKICREYENIIPKLPSEITVRKWVEANELPEVVKNMEIEVIAKTRSREIAEQVDTKNRQIEIYNQIVEKGVEELEEMEFTSAMEATKAIDMGIQGSRKITNDTVNLQFIDDVLTAITNIIVDEEQRRAIGIELRKIFQKYSN